MQNNRMAGLFLAGLLSVPLAGSGAWAQSTEVAYGAAPRADYVVFLDNDARLSAVAGDTIKQAAQSARSARRVQVIGRADYAEAVKDKLLQDGVSAQAIVVTPMAAQPLAPAPDMADPMARRVEITF